MLKKLEKYLTKIMIGVAVSFFTFSFFIYSLQMLLRIFFSKSIFWIDPLSSYLFALSALYGSALAIRNDENIKIEIFKKLNQHKIIKTLKELISLLASLFLLSIFMLHLKEELLRGEVAFLNLKKWLLDIPYIFFIGAGVIYYLNQLINTLKKS